MLATIMKIWRGVLQGQKRGESSDKEAFSHIGKLCSSLADARGLAPMDLLHSNPGVWIQEHDNRLHEILVPQCRVAGSWMFPNRICTILFPRLTLLLLYLAHTQLSTGCTIFSDIVSKQEEWSRAPSVERLASFDAYREYLRRQFLVLVAERENEQQLKERAEYLMERDMCHLGARLLELVDDEKGWTRFLKTENTPHSAGQNIVDLFQTLLKFPPLRPVRGKLLKALLQLSGKTELYPWSLYHQGMGELCGGFADVYKGTSQNQAVAVKIMRKLNGKSVSNLTKKIRQEAIIWNQLHHPNILPFYGIMLKPDGEGLHRTCLISPWMDNGNVLEYIQAKPNVNREDLIRDVAKGLDYLHSFRPAIVHGDIKGDNVLVSPSGRACLTDFGLGRVLQDKEWLQSTTSNLCGVRLFLAPELLEGQKVEGHSIRKSLSTDIYAFGCLCYQIYTGYPRFFNIPAPLPQITAILTSEPCDKPALMRDELWVKVQECWNRRPETRPLIADFYTIFSEERSSSNVTGFPKPLEEWEWDSGIRSRMRLCPETFTISSESSSGPTFKLEHLKQSQRVTSRVIPRSRQTI